MRRYWKPAGKTERSIPRTRWQRKEFCRTVSMKKSVMTASCVACARYSSRKSPGVKVKLAVRSGTISGKETVLSMFSDERWCEKECRYGATSYWLAILVC